MIRFIQLTANLFMSEVDMIEFLVFITGLIIGSFLNVCIYRIPRQESIVFPPSHCTECGQALGFFDLIPVASYIYLRGHCRSCGNRISPRYPLVELLTAVVFLLLYMQYRLTVPFAGYAILMSALIAVFFIDLDFMIIPDKLVLFASIIGICFVSYHLCSPLKVYGDSEWWNPFLGALIGSGSLFLVAVIGSLLFKTAEAMGGGDIKIMIPIGLLLGWRLTILTLFMAVIVGGVVSLILLALKITSRKSSIPFGPFIVVAAYAAIMWGYPIINWYLGQY